MESETDLRYEKEKDFELYEWQQDAYDKVCHFIDNSHLGIKTVALNWCRCSGASMVITRLLYEKFDYFYTTGGKCTYAGVINKFDKRYISKPEDLKGVDGKVMCLINALINLKDVELIHKQMKENGITEYMIIIHKPVNKYIDTELYLNICDVADYLFSFYDYTKIEDVLISSKVMRYSEKSNPERFLKDYAINEKLIEVEVSLYDKLMQDLINGDKDKETFNKIKMLKELISIKNQL